MSRIDVLLAWSASSLQPEAMSIVCMNFLAWPRLKKLRRWTAPPIMMIFLRSSNLALASVREGMSKPGSSLALAYLTTAWAMPSSFLAVSVFFFLVLIGIDIFHEEKGVSQVLSALYSHCVG